MTDQELRYPKMKADLDLCEKYLVDLCERSGKPPLSVPALTTDFDMQFSAAFDELMAYRNTGLLPEQVVQHNSIEDTL